MNPDFDPEAFNSQQLSVTISTMTPGTSARDASRPPLRRPLDKRAFAGVCAGLSIHLGFDVKYVRWAFVGGAFLGVGVVLYIWLWLLVPAGDPHEVSRQEKEASSSAIHRGLKAPWRDVVRKLPLTEIALGVVLLIAAALIAAAGAGVDVTTWILPLLVVIAGALLGWSQLDEMQRARWNVDTGSRTPVSVLRIVGGIALVGVGAVLLTLGEREGGDLIAALVPVVAVIVGAALVLAPWWLRLMRERGAERAARVREAERADIAAHLHDSVLQTLALIQMRSGDSEAVSRLARAQERELREWLFADRDTSETSFASAVRAVMAEVEDRFAATIDTVVVGDAELSNGWLDSGTAILGALREAASNAVVHGGAPVTVYVEVASGGIEAFVRDRGAGFILDDVPTDRLGVRESIIGRVERRGGTVKIRTLAEPDTGTEVALSVPVPNGG